MVLMVFVYFLTIYPTTDQKTSSQTQYTHGAKKSDINWYNWAWIVLLSDWWGTRLQMGTRYVLTIVSYSTKPPRWYQNKVSIGGYIFILGRRYG